MTLAPTTHHFDSVEDWFPDGFGLTSHVLQLDPGRLDCRFTQIDLGDLVLEFMSFGASVMVHEAFQGHDLPVSGVLAAQRVPRLFGREMSNRALVPFAKDREVGYRIEAGTETFCVFVKAKTRDRLGWENLNPLPFDADTDAMARLRAQVLHVRDSAALGIPLEKEAVGDALLDQLAPLLESASGRETLVPTPAYRTLRDMLAAPIPTDTNQAIEALADKLNLPQRSLYRSFADWPGIPPSRLLRLQKLHSLRAKLLAADTDTDTFNVTQAGLDCGFTHLGRMAVYYRRQFGETPRDTLMRRRARMI